ncbi:MAG TPA: hypothetical protein VKE40_17575 [Gemmataceae bacterium]|nr:hypothetical protein [Gemmataceae bacterium]
MKRLLMMAVAVTGLTGCGPSGTDVAQSQVNQLAESWDGTEKFTPADTDPWGEPYTAKVEKGDAYYHLTVRSNGPDRRPQTKDDIVAHRSVKHTDISKAAGAAAERIGEGLGKGLGRGGVAGIKEGITGKKPDEKKDGEKNVGQKKD